ncbi:MAG TPA: hypothetical protein VFB12_02100 [Ktedonobacteraceae bacterium]|nr:hypothetical protein [Ktedonobacteraceae bacterium]
MSEQQHDFHQSPDHQGQNDNKPPQQASDVLSSRLEILLDAFTPRDSSAGMGCFPTLVLIAIVSFIEEIARLILLNTFSPSLFPFPSPHIGSSIFPGIHLSQSLMNVLNIMLGVSWIGVLVILTLAVRKWKWLDLWGNRIITLYALIALCIEGIVDFVQTLPYLGERWMYALGYAGMALAGFVPLLLTLALRFRKPLIRGLRRIHL